MMSSSFDCGSETMVRGFDAAFLTGEGHAGHFGLHGMRERAKLIGGDLTVWEPLRNPVRRSSSSFRRPAPMSHLHAVSWFS